MENCTGNPRCTAISNDLSCNETSAERAEETNICSDSMVEQNKAAMDTIAECEDTKIPELLEQDGGEEIQEPDPRIPSVSCGDEALAMVSELKTDLGLVANGIKDNTEVTIKIADEIHKVHKLYHNEFASRLQSMQEELERYREIEKGRIFDDILRDIAKLYSENLSVLEEILDEKAHKRLRYMFLDMLQLLESHGVSKLKSKQGDKRNTKHCQIIERISTDNPELHDTVAKSLNIGFYVENRSLVKEMMHMYIYAQKDDDKPNN